MNKYRWGLAACLFFCSGELLAQSVGSVESLSSTSHSVGVPNTNNVISFTWSAPSSENLAGYSFVLNDSENTTPDATLENDSPGATSSTTSALSDGEYYFHIRAVNELGAASEVKHLGPLVIDTTGPSAVSSVEVTAGDRRNSLRWVTPSDNDFDRVVVRVRTDGQYPSAPTNGDGVVNDESTAAAASATFVHAGLTNDTRYYYSFFALDNLGNVSSVATATGTPVSPPDEVDDSAPDDNSGGAPGEGGSDDEEPADDNPAEEEQTDEETTEDEPVSGGGTGGSGGSQTPTNSGSGNQPDLSGEVELNDDITDVEVGAGATVTGGSLGGVITGDADAPALLNTRIREGSTLSNVVIGADAELGDNLDIGPGVRFENTGMIPPGQDLSGAFSKRESNGAGSLPPVIDLGSNVLSGSQSSLLDSINTVPDIAGLGMALTQNEDGLLSLDIGAESYRVVPLSVSKAPADAQPGLHYGEDGRIIFIDDNGLALSCSPGMPNLPAFTEELAGSGLSLTVNDNGQLRVADGSGAVITASPGLGAFPSDLPGPGIYTEPDPVIPGVLRYVLVQEGGNGLIQQSLNPAPHDWSQLDGMLSGIDGTSSATLSVDGFITLTLGDTSLRLVMDYVVEPGSGGNSSGETTFEEAGDLNGDGVNDYIVIFPDGARQRVYVSL